MPARKSRSEARARAIAVFMESLDRVIPADESAPLRGSTFRDWEDQVAEVRKAVLPTLLEGRAALEQNAAVVEGGPCPHCGSPRAYLEAGETSPEVRSPDGPVVLPRQHCRCRACGRPFSPFRRVTGGCRPRSR